MLIDEFSVTLYRVDADAEDLRFPFELAPGIPQATGLSGAAGRVVLWIEIEDDGSSGEIRQRNLRAISVSTSYGGSSEMRGGVSDVEIWHR